MIKIKTMAARLSKTERVQYKILHNLSSLDLLFEKKKKKKKRSTLSTIRTECLGVFNAERLVACRKDSEVGEAIRCTWPCLVIKFIIDLCREA